MTFPRKIPAPRLVRSCAAPVAAFLLFASLSGCERELIERKAARVYMGTVVEITVLGKDPKRLDSALEAGFREIARVEREMSSFRPDSEVSLINRNAGKEPVQVGSELFWLLSRAEEISGLSRGAFDITVSGLKGLWSFDPEKPRVPSSEEISSRLPLVSWKMLKLDPEKKTAFLEKPGMRIDLGAIAKGYAVDRAVEAVREHGVAMALVNAGGDLRALGSRGGRPWRVGIQHPRERDQVVAVLELKDEAVATSGDYEKFIEVSGKRYCHILDPRTGRPAQGAQSVTVLAKQAWRADALATALFVLGPEEGLDLAERLPGVETFIIYDDMKFKMSSGLRGRLEFLVSGEREKGSRPRHHGNP